MSIIKLKEVSFSYAEDNKKVLEDINLDIKSGELVLIIGPSGGGKSTLLSMLKHEITPTGNMTGEIIIKDKDVKECKFNEVAYLFQNPDSQLVSDTVYNELIYSLKNLNLDEEELSDRLGEIVTYLNLNSSLESKVSTLSGGNKQIVNIASLLLMHPEILILDEPTSQIDPIHYDEIINLILKLNNENNITTIITEHRYDRLFFEADRVIFINNGKVILNEAPDDFIKNVYKDEIKEIYPFLREVEGSKERIIEESNEEKEVLVSAEDISYSYEGSKLNLNYVNFEAKKGEITSIVGTNGCGKSTFLKLLGYIYYPLTGKISLEGKKYSRYKKDLWKHIGYVPQDVNEFFTFDSIEEEFNMLREALEDRFDEELYKKLLKEYRIEKLLKNHPVDVSGGEKQTIIIALQLLKKSKLLILDEPTKGLDPVLKERLGKTLIDIKNNGTSIVLVTHDIDFIYNYCDKCSMMFNGKIGRPLDINTFFEKKLFYLPKHIRKKRAGR